MKSVIGIGIFAALLFSVNCPAADADYKSVSDSIVKYQYIGEYAMERLDKILTDELPEFSSFKITYPPTQNSVKLYRIIYNTVIPEKNNKPVIVSGLIAIPEVKSKSMPVISYQHGTVFTKTEVPSSPEESMETRLMIARFAGQGYIVIAADYIGKGFSSESDSYLVKESSAQACIDMLLASKIVCKDLGVEMDGLFLSGWSQGSYVTMVLLNRLEKLGVKVKGAAVASTPNDPFLCMNKWISVSSELDVVWLVGVVAILINSYEQYYNLQGLSKVAIKSQYYQAANDLYNNNLTSKEAYKKLPATVKELLNEDFASASSIAGNNFYQLLQQNQPYCWRYKTTTKFYYGLIDEVVPPYIATLPVEYQKIMNGAASEAVFAGEKANHRGTFLYGIKDQKVWFDSLRNN